MLPPHVFELTMGQELELRSLELKAEAMPEEELRRSLLWVSKMLMIRQNMVSHLVQENLLHGVGMEAFNAIQKNGEQS